MSFCAGIAKKQPPNKVYLPRLAHRRPCAMAPEVKHQDLPILDPTHEAHLPRSRHKGSPFCRLSKAYSEAATQGDFAKTPSSRTSL